MSLKEDIKRWVVLDNQHKKANEQVKQIRDMKNGLGNSIMSDLAADNITNPVIKISDGKLRFVETRQANVIGYKFLLECFNEYLEDDNKAVELLEFIKEKRTYTNVSSIKRIYNKE
ncbi:hypothetical protein PGAG_00215 [Phaeocystis globosa virus 12T]|uniref:Uncharacterized protein n=1 Tax=Phaeocystis globosa virus PgV-16T TaxID=3071227 RepID=A0AC59EX80_9VIRU|nr:hypothetical protein PGCG_00255 [Phaeocystis globosa virus]AET73104.1 hypothetical protein PGAG_00215 [Phaeocystis globosa virus 12T]AET73926.1 hypothetical protein PGBG_00218 [Phaeocystis globosa virus 14T]AGM15566.1 hypothetical protein PGCG_00255 [Phaeocystis globosa virus PgV-16T]UYE94296.1 DUF5760 family protein [Phaeocystis globosa virus]